MSRRSVRAYVTGQLEAVSGLDVYDHQPKSTAAGDIAFFHKVTSRETRETLGRGATLGAGTSKTVQYGIVIELATVDPDEQAAERHLDDLAEGVFNQIRTTALPASITDTVTNLTTTVRYIGEDIEVLDDIQEQLAGESVEAMVYSALVIRIELTEQLNQ